MMQYYITLDRVKEHLNIESCFNEQDSYLLGLLSSAQSAVERDLDTKLSEYLLVGGVLNPICQHAILTLIANWYENRNLNTYGNVKEVPKTYNYLLGLLRNYGCNEKNVR